MKQKQEKSFKSEILRGTVLLIVSCLAAVVYAAGSFGETRYGFTTVWLSSIPENFSVFPAALPQENP